MGKKRDACSDREGIALTKRIMGIMIALVLLFGMLNPSALADGESNATSPSENTEEEGLLAESENGSTSGQSLEGAGAVGERPEKNAPDTNKADVTAPATTEEAALNSPKTQEGATEEGTGGPEASTDISATLTNEAINEVTETTGTDGWSVSVSVTSLSWAVQKNIRQLYSVAWNSKICAYERIAEDPIVTWTLADSAAKGITLKNDSSFTVTWSADLVSQGGVSDLFSVFSANSQPGGRSASGTLNPGESCVVMVELNSAAFERFAEDAPESATATGDVAISFSAAG